MTCPACTRHTCPDPAVCRSILTPTVTAPRYSRASNVVVGICTGLIGLWAAVAVLEMCGVMG